METTMKSRRIAYWCVCGLWCSAGALAVGALLTYLTNWPIGALAGLATAIVLARLLVATDGMPVRVEDEDLADDLRTGLKYSNHPGNVLKAD
jgi:hypothetical protein